MEYSGRELPEPLLEQQEEGHAPNISNYGKKKIPGKAKKPILQSAASSDNHSRQVENAVVVQCTSEDSSMICGTGCDFAEPDNRDADLELRAAAARKLIYAGGFCLLFMAVEIAGGIYANSLAILTDAAHLLSDVTGFAVSLFAIWASSWQATARQTYGFHRVEILGALVSIQIIWLVTGILVYEAIDRIIHNAQAVNGFLMFWIATLGLLVNVVMIFILGHGHDHGRHGHGHGNGQHDEETHNHSHNDEDRRDAFLQKQMNLQSGPGREPTNIASCGHEEDTLSHIECKGHREVASPPSENINIKGAYLHVFGDLVQSIGVMIAGALIWYNPKWKIMDLVCTLFFSLLVLGTTIKMLRDILEVLMESTPREIDKSILETGLLKIEGVVAVHDLHIWAITLGKSLLACHIETAPSADSNLVLHNAIAYCKNEFNISHVTVQIEHN